MAWNSKTTPHTNAAGGLSNQQRRKTSDRARGSRRAKPRAAAWPQTTLSGDMRTDDGRRGLQTSMIPVWWRPCDPKRHPGARAATSPPISLPAWTADASEACAHVFVTRHWRFSTPQRRQRGRLPHRDGV